MKIFETSVRKPISTVLIFAGIIIMGLFSLKNLAIDMYPKMDIPAVMVMTTYEGANAADIETNVTRILEDNLNTVENLKAIRSRSSDNLSVIILELEWGSEITEAANDVRDVIGRVQRYLPDEVDPPSVFKFSSSMIPVMVLYATANESYPALNKILDDKVVNPLNRVSGVGAVNLMGAPKREVQVNVDPQKLEAYNLSVEQLGQIIALENQDIPGGTLDIGQQTINIRAKGELESSDQMREIIIANHNGRPVYLTDVAEIRDTLEKSTLDERINGEKAVRIVIQKQSDANSVAIVREVTEMLPGLQESLPSDVKMGIVMDTSESIQRSIDSLSETVMFAFVFVMLVVLVFLGKWRATFIIVLTIPISLITSFIYLFATGSTLNIISLSSLSIAIGMVVDDAIVVLENITKHMERGSSSREASIYGTNEVWLAVIATTLVVIAVFMPLTMLPGMAGIMFKELGWIVSLVTLVSTIAAVSLTPMLTAIMLKNENMGQKSYKGIGIVFKPIEKFLDKLDHWYADILTWSVRHRTVILAVAIVIFLGSVVLMQGTAFDFYPKSDDSKMSASVELEQGVGIEYTSKIALEIESMWREKYPEIEVVSTSAGTDASGNSFTAMNNTGTHMVSYMMKLKPKIERERSIFEISDLMRDDLESFAEIVKYSVEAGGGSPGSSDGDIEVKVYGHDMDVTDALAKELMDSIKLIPGTADVQLSREDMRPEYRIIFDREKLATYGLNTATASQYVRNRINGLTASKYREDGDEYDIIVRYGEDFRTSLEQVQNITIYNNQGRPVKLREVGTIIEEFAPPTIERRNRQRVVSIQITLAGASMSDVAEPIYALIADTEIPEGVFIEIGGAYEDMTDTMADLMTLLVLIVVLVYIVMATQFESFRAPFIIMFSLPFAFTGVFLALWLTGTSMSIIAMIGAIMLVGIVVKNGIVMVDFTNLLRDRGMSLNQSVINAGKSRLRPVLMTSLTTILGMLPLALSTGEGAEIWRPMGIAVIGGLTFSTLLTLIVIPVMYSLFGARKLKKDRRHELQIFEEENIKH